MYASAHASKGRLLLGNSLSLATAALEKVARPR